MKKQIIKGVAIGSVIALVVVVCLINFPEYTCQQASVDQPVNCNRVIDVTPGFILGSFVIFMVIGGGIGWVYSNRRIGSTMK